MTDTGDHNDIELDGDDTGEENGEDHGDAIDTSSDAHQIALEFMKQLITLSSGILVLSATFVEKFKSDAFWLQVLLAASWLSLIIAVFFGLDAISAIVKSRLRPEEHDWSTGRGRFSAGFSKYAFVAGIATFVLFAYGSILTTRGEPKPAQQPPVEIRNTTN